MASKIIYEFRDYKKYVAQKILSFPKQGHGMKSQIARHLRCHSAYVTQVLSGAADFSLEQAELLNELFAHNEDEAVFFLLLVQYQRAGNHQLAERLKKELEASATEKLKLKNRLDKQRALKNEPQTRYYSSWLYSAVHILVTIPDFQTLNALSEKLKVAPVEVRKILDFLSACELIEEKKGKWQAKESQVYIGSDSLSIKQHHTNWRLRCIDSLDIAREKDLHYSGAISCSFEDAALIREILIGTIDKIRKLVKSSKEEDLFCYTVDLFKV